jgi:hypothetical protein
MSWNGRNGTYGIALNRLSMFKRLNGAQMHALVGTEEVKTHCLVVVMD